MKVYEIDMNLFQVELGKYKAVVVSAKNENEAVKKAKLRKF